MSENLGILLYSFLTVQLKYHAAQHQPKLALTSPLMHVWEENVTAMESAITTSTDMSCLVLVNALQVRETVENLYHMKINVQK